MTLPGAVILQALYNNTVIGAHIYFQHDDIVYCHLGAYSETGYKVGATDALDLFSFDYFADKARWLNLGGGSGITSDGTDGLSYYKKSWATDTRITYFWGHVFDRKRYEDVLSSMDIGETDYFPAYRKGEFE